MKKFLAIFSLTLTILFPVQTFAAITFDNNGLDTGGGRTGVNTTTVSATLAANATLLVFVVLTPGAASTTSVTYNGTNMPLLNLSTGIGQLAMYGLPTPTSGTHDIVVNFSGVLGGGQTEQVFWASFTGASQTSPFSVTATTDNRALNITTTVDNSVVVDDFLSNLVGITVNAAQTQLNGDNIGGYRDGDSYKAVPSAGATTMAWAVDSGPNTGHSHVAVALAPPFVPRAPNQDLISFIDN